MAIRELLLRKAHLLGLVTISGVVVASVVLWWRDGQLSPTGVQTLLYVTIGLSAALWLSATLAFWLAWRALWQVRQLAAADAADVRRMARQEFVQALYRFVGKSCLALAMLLLGLIRQHSVMVFLRTHPLTLYLLIVMSMTAFTVLDLLELPSRWEFRRGSRKNRG